MTRREPNSQPNPSDVALDPTGGAEASVRVGRRYRANRLAEPYDAVVIGSGIGGLSAAAQGSTASIFIGFSMIFINFFDRSIAKPEKILAAAAAAARSLSKGKKGKRRRELIAVFPAGR